MNIYNCLICANFTDSKDGVFKCPAFPEGIPREKLQEYDPEAREKECANGIFYKRPTHPKKID